VPPVDPTKAAEVLGDATAQYVLSAACVVLVLAVGWLVRQLLAKRAADGGLTDVQAKVLAEIPVSLAVFASAVDAAFEALRGKINVRFDHLDTCTSRCERLQELLELERQQSRALQEVINAAVARKLGNGGT